MYSAYIGSSRPKQSYRLVLNKALYDCFKEKELVFKILSETEFELRESHLDDMKSHKISTSKDYYRIPFNSKFHNIEEMIGKYEVEKEGDIFILTKKSNSV